MCNNCIGCSWYSTLAGGNWLFMCLAGGFYFRMVLVRELGVVGRLVRDIMTWLLVRYNFLVCSLVFMVACQCLCMLLVMGVEATLWGNYE